MRQTTFQYRHERDPLFLLALKFYSVARKIDFARGAAPLRAKLERAASRMLICLAEALDLPDVRTRRLESAYACGVKLAAVLAALRDSDFVDLNEHGRVLQLLHALTSRIEALKVPASPPKAPRARLTDDVTSNVEASQTHDSFAGHAEAALGQCPSTSGIDYAEPPGAVPAVSPCG